jgi:hypothetical protein
MPRDPDTTPDRSKSAPESSPRDSDAKPQTSLQNVTRRVREGMARHEAGGKDALFGMLDVGDALLDYRRWQSPEGDYHTSGECEEYAERSAGLKRSDYHKVITLAGDRDAIAGHVFAEHHTATARGVAYQYPTWREMYRKFHPGKGKRKGKGENNPPSDPDADAPDDTPLDDPAELARKLAEARKQILIEREAADRLTIELVAARQRVADLEAQLGITKPVLAAEPPETETAQPDPTPQGVLSPANGQRAEPTEPKGTKPERKPLDPNRRSRFGVLIRHQGESTKAFKARLAADKASRQSAEPGDAI